MAIDRRIGFLSSLDDFYMMSSGLMMTQTTNGILDQSVYDHNISPRSLLAWQRVRAACVMARSGKEYHDVMKTHYSGTYANQYMILNLNLFEPRKPLKSGLLYVLEEMPGKVQTRVGRSVPRYKCCHSARFNYI